MKLVRLVLPESATPEDGIRYVREAEAASGLQVDDVVPPWELLSWRELGYWRCSRSRAGHCGWYGLPQTGRTGWSERATCPRCGSDGCAPLARPPDGAAPLWLRTGDDVPTGQQPEEVCPGFEHVPVEARGIIRDLVTRIASLEEAVSELRAVVDGLVNEEADGPSR